MLLRRIRIYLSLSMLRIVRHRKLPLRSSKNSIRTNWSEASRRKHICFKICVVNWKPSGKSVRVKNKFSGNEFSDWLQMNRCTPVLRQPHRCVTLLNGICCYQRGMIVITQKLMVCLLSYTIIFDAMYTS